MANGAKTRRWMTVRLGLGSSGLLMTPDEFDGLPDLVFARHRRYELINRVLIVTLAQGNGEHEFQ